MGTTIYGKFVYTVAVITGFCWILSMINVCDIFFFNFDN